MSVQNTDERLGKYNVHSNLEHMQRSAVVHAQLWAEQVHLDFCKARREITNRQWMQLESRISRPAALFALKLRHYLPFVALFCLGILDLLPFSVLGWIRRPGVSVGDVWRAININVRCHNVCPA